MHICTFISDEKDKAQLTKAKNFRKMNQTNSNEFYHYQYWVITDPELAKSMGMSTSEDDVGDLYVLRKSSPFTLGAVPNLNLRGYEYISEKIHSSKDKDTSLE